MATSSQIAGTGTQNSSMPNGTNVQWRDPQNVNSDNGVTAAAPPVGGLTSSQTATRYLEGSEFSHSIPAGATIDGISLEIDFTIVGTSVKDYDVRISGATAGLSNDLSDGTDLPSNTTKTWGGSTELWGKTWTISELEADTFTALFSASGSVGTNFFSTNVDYIKTIVHYTEAGGGGGASYQIKYGDAVVEEVRLGSRIINEIRFGDRITN